MLRILQSGNSLPYSFIVDPNAEFQPGQIAQLNLMGNQIVCGVSDGTAPLGIIDDMKTNAFTRPSINEIVIVPVVGVISNGRLVAATDTMAPLENAYILERSFVANIEVVLNPKNGIITILQGTPLNYDSTGSGQPDSIRVVVSYTYQVPNIPGVNSTEGSGKVTVWFDRIIFQTDQFETNQAYPLNANLFVSESGLLTTRMPSVYHPSVAMVTAPPSPLHGFLEAIYL